MIFESILLRSLIQYMGTTKIEMETQCLSSSDLFLLDVVILQLLHNKKVLSTTPPSRRGSYSTDKVFAPNLDASFSTNLSDSNSSDHSLRNVLNKQHFIIEISNVFITDSDIQFIDKLLPWIKKDKIIKRLRELKNDQCSWLRHPAVMSIEPVTSIVNKYNFEKDMKFDKTNNDENNQEVLDIDIEQGPKITIHVCDEAKGLKQDFECPKNLLVQEMRYFADYLSPDQQTWEDVDISVHCDVTIFHWLMKFVKRHLPGADPMDELETTNVVSILISSDFLKMDALVEICIQFCHDNMSAILATPCNMSCLGDHLVYRIAKMFTHCEADDIKDKKDKFKSLIFLKKIQLLLTDNEISVGLFKCLHCSQILTAKNHKLLPCQFSRACIGLNGDLVYAHEPDNQFDLASYISDLHLQVGSWPAVFWRLWGFLYYLWCTRCHQYFSCDALGHCAFHLSAVKFDNVIEDKSSNSLGVYPCCGVKTLRFDPFKIVSGCKFRDHVIGNPPDSHEDMKDSVHKTLLIKRDSICLTTVPESSGAPDFSTVDIFANEMFLVPSLAHLHLRSQEQKPMSAKPDIAKKADRSDSSSSSDDSYGYDTGEADAPKLAVKVKTKTRKGSSGKRKNKELSLKEIDPFLDVGSFGLKKSKRWDCNKSLRTNQDAQRHEDQRRMEQLVLHVEQLREGPLTNSARNVKPKEFAGGIFAKLEYQWKLSYGNMSGQKIPPMQIARTERARTAGYRAVPDRRVNRASPHQPHFGSGGVFI